MKNARIATSVVAGTALVVLACGNAQAAPESTPGVAPLQVDLGPGIQYRVNAVDHSVVVDTPLGSLATRGGDFQVLDNQGALVAGAPITYAEGGSDGDSGEVSAAISPMAQAAMAPVSDPSQLPPIRDVDATADFNAALGLAATQFGLATGVGTLAGGVIGMGLGCVGGALTGGFVALPTGPIAAPAAAFGCLVGASVGAGLGGVTGAALLGIPVGIASAVQMYDTLHAAGEI
ncbi:hypothetical protein ACWELJ_00900 [Nocardia sp. NPDC004582]